MISHVSVGQQLNDNHGNRGDQDDMNVAASVKTKLKNEPNKQQSAAETRYRHRYLLLARLHTIRTLHRLDRSAGNEEPHRLRVTARLRINRRHSPVVGACGKFTHDMSLPFNWSVEKHVLKFFVAGDLEPVPGHAPLFIPLDRRRENNFASGRLLSNRTAGKEGKKRWQQYDNESGKHSGLSLCNLCALRVSLVRFVFRHIHQRHREHKGRTENTRSSQTTELRLVYSQHRER